MFRPIRTESDASVWVGPGSIFRTPQKIPVFRARITDLSGNGLCRPGNPPLPTDSWFSQGSDGPRGLKSLSFLPAFLWHAGVCLPSALQNKKKLELYLLLISRFCKFSPHVSFTPGCSPTEPYWKERRRVSSHRPAPASSRPHASSALTCSSLLCAHSTVLESPLGSSREFYATR